MVARSRMYCHFDSTVQYMCLSVSDHDGSRACAQSINPERASLRAVTLRRNTFRVMSPSRVSAPVRALRVCSSLISHRRA